MGAISKRNALQSRVKGKKGKMSTVIVSSHGSFEDSEGTEQRSKIRTLPASLLPLSVSLGYVIISSGVG